MRQVGRAKQGLGLFVQLFARTAQRMVAGRDHVGPVRKNLLRNVGGNAHAVRVGILSVYNAKVGAHLPFERGQPAA
ncbi:hypothetical protein SDC9_145365 [bioreactor metagenome]|uniref:Uncharacterized protein n=1 Tax=bioreactor metagenome TaxID=1076179 RepID=A0A645EBZ6_9ZZZZ